VVLPILGRNAARIATVSQLSREHLVQHGVARAGKIAVTYNGADHALRWDKDAARLELPGFRPFVLCLGRSQEYKNTGLMWRLAPVLDGMGVDVAIAGDIDRGTLASFGPVPGNARLLGRISDDDFAFALSRAVCLVFPSRIEGFGLPAAEAMALGCPVVASSAPCLPEVCGDAALYADPDDLDGWTRAIGRLLHEPELRADLIARGLERAKAFSWRRIAETYLILMAQVDLGEAGAVSAGRVLESAR
jgi:glycosyltransferase involved in cell wall biosynthesis